MVPVGTPIAVVAGAAEQVDEAFMRLARVGLETVTGFILIDKYTGEKRTIEQVGVEQVAELAKTEKIQFVDVRRPAEHGNGHAPGTVNIPLDKLPADFEQLDPEAPTYVICQGGYRSSLGTSILENAGFRNIYNVTGGTAAWQSAGLETEVSATACAGTR
jgi:hydroxyacylglutathione hydrolase